MTITALALSAAMLKSGRDPGLYYIAFCKACAALESDGGET